MGRDLFVVPNDLLAKCYGLAENKTLAQHIFQLVPGIQAYYLLDPVDDMVWAKAFCFFSTEKAPKIEMRIIHGILCFQLASLISK